MTLTAGQVVDIVAAQLAAGRTMPTPTPGPRDDLYAGFHVLTEEALWGTARVWADRADAVTLATYRHRAARWARAYFGPTFPVDLDAAPATDSTAGTAGPGRKAAA